jgi:hypothetical protein
MRTVVAISSALTLTTKKTTTPTHRCKTAERASRYLKSQSRLVQADPERMQVGADFRTT